MKSILVLNGPNLNLLGRREPHIYGNQGMDSIIAKLSEEFPDIEISYLQSNHEGDLIDWLQATEADGVVLNAGGYTHTSVALADAVAAIDVPVVEVHISNVHARDEFRRHSFLSPVCCGVIAGFGADVYRLGVLALLGRKSC